MKTALTIIFRRAGFWAVEHGLRRRLEGSYCPPETCRMYSSGVIGGSPCSARCKLAALNPPIASMAGPGVCWGPYPTHPAAWQ